MKVAYTIFMDHDGYWIAARRSAAAIMTAPERHRSGAMKAGSKIGACRLALEMALHAGATELHLDGVGVTVAIRTEANKAGIKVVLYPPDSVTDLTSERRRIEVTKNSRQLIGH
jgi:hypothetical protein